jgi:hypothetical protein
MSFSLRTSLLCLLTAATATASPVSVTSLVQKALATPPELRFYEAQVDAARGGKTSAGEIANPELLTGVGNWRVRDLATGGVSDGPTWSVQLTQTFEWPGRLALRKAIAQKDIELAQLGVEQFRTALAARVQNLCWKVLAGQEKTRAAEEVARGALRGGDGNVFEVVTEDALEGVVLGDVTHRSARGVGVDVNNVSECGPAHLERSDHGARRC